jgi:hypothetical protein
MVTIVIKLANERHFGLYVVYGSYQFYIIWETRTVDKDKRQG